MRRFGQLIHLKPEATEEYKRLHAKIWPEIEHAIRESGIANYSIFFRDGTLFAYFEYTGPDEEYTARMERLSSAPRMKEWWTITDAMQVPVANHAVDEWWAAMEEVFYQA